MSEQPERRKLAVKQEEEPSIGAWKLAMKKNVDRINKHELKIASIGSRRRPSPRRIANRIDVNGFG